MTDEEKPVAEEVKEETTPEEYKSSFEVVQGSLDKFLAAANVNAVYSKPIRQGDTMVITASENLGTMAFGVGEGTGGDEKTRGGGSGGGGGGRVFSRPVAVIVCTPTGVSIQPVMDRTKIWLAALTAVGFMLTTLGKMRRPPRGKW
jgi:uncharacterized spore protein YtfJ